jgi:hypothetical protein
MHKSKDVAIVKARISQRLSEKPTFYTFFKKKLSA